MAHRRITRTQGQSTRTRRQVVELVRQNASLWTRGSAYPPAGTDILRLPFRFTLNASQELPSCYYEARRRRGCVGYSIEAVGVRTGLHFNKRVYLPMSVLPSNLKGASMSQELRAGLITAWRNVEFKKAIRRGIWGDFSNVQVIVSFTTLFA